jgi:hypothetical protein
MEIRLITTQEDFEKVYKTLNQYDYPLSFYEFQLKHSDVYKKESNKLIGAFQNNHCLGHLSYKILFAKNNDNILEINELFYQDVKAYKILMNFTDLIAQEEKCCAIKISNKKIDKLKAGLFDRFENILKSIAL